MKKFSVIFLILFLILFTAFIKNSTKRTDDQIFVIKENLRSLNKDFENFKLENDYLSSAEKLLEFQYLYFDDELVKNDIRNINTINIRNNKLEIERFRFINE
ncbi:cell division protein FtsL [Pelagibacterales bacterium SAG-MED39]|nr:cell division protein FtsL [Pelagibacterales bacterium SAG-MED39]